MPAPSTCAASGLTLAANLYPSGRLLADLVPGSQGSDPSGLELYRLDLLPEPPLFANGFD